MLIYSRYLLLFFLLGLFVFIQLEKANASSFPWMFIPSSIARPDSNHVHGFQVFGLNSMDTDCKVQIYSKSTFSLDDSIKDELVKEWTLNRSSFTVSQQNNIHDLHIKVQCLLFDTNPSDGISINTRVSPSRVHIFQLVPKVDPVYIHTVERISSPLDCDSSVPACITSHIFKQTCLPLCPSKDALMRDIFASNEDALSCHVMEVDSCSMRSLQSQLMSNAQRIQQQAKHIQAQQTLIHAHHTGMSDGDLTGDVTYADGDVDSLVNANSMLQMKANQANQRRMQAESDRNDLEVECMSVRDRVLMLEEEVDVCTSQQNTTLIQLSNIRNTHTHLNTKHAELNAAMKTSLVELNSCRSNISLMEGEKDELEGSLRRNREQYLSCSHNVTSLSQRLHKSKLQTTQLQVELGNCESGLSAVSSQNEESNTQQQVLQDTLQAQLQQSVTSHQHTTRNLRLSEDKVSLLEDEVSRMTEIKSQLSEDAEKREKEHLLKMEQCTHTLESKDIALNNAMESLSALENERQNAKRQEENESMFLGDMCEMECNQLRHTHKHVQRLEDYTDSNTHLCSKLNVVNANIVDVDSQHIDTNTPTIKTDNVSAERGWSLRRIIISVLLLCATVGHLLVCIAYVLTYSHQDFDVQNTLSLAKNVASDVLYTIIGHDQNK